MPYFWSDQFGHRCQHVGRGPDDTLIWREHHDGGAATAAWLGKDGRLAAVLTVDRGRELAHARRALKHDLVPDSARLADPAIPLHDA